MLQYFKYRIPFCKPFRTAGKEYKFREGIILTYKEGNITAYGEAAPLPGYSIETLEQVQEVLLLNKATLQDSLINKTDKSFLTVLEQIHHFPSLSFGLDTLIHDLAAKREDKSLLEYLFPASPKSLHCNATLSLQDFDSTISQAERLIKEGYHTLKIKVGSNFKQETKILKSIRNRFPEIKIRIDANQAWDPPQAISNLKVLEDLNIEYCEQPVAAGDHSDLKRVKNNVGISIAADESVRNKNEAIQLSESESTDLLILKPMLMGSLRNIFVTKDVADTHNIEVVFTSSLESAIGRSMTAVLAAGLGTTSLAQGLSTGKLLENDVAFDDWLNKPVIEFPPSKGLGISLHSEELEEF